MAFFNPRLLLRKLFPFLKHEFDARPLMLLQLNWFLAHVELGAYQNLNHCHLEFTGLLLQELGK